jgi:hypothetical protein
MAAKQGLYANINAKRERIAEGSGETMRKPGTKGAPTAKAFKQSAKTAKVKPVKKKNGGEMKAVDAKAKPGLAKLPTAVRNKMGYMKDGGDVMDSKVTYVKKKDGNRRVKIC